MTDPGDHESLLERTARGAGWVVAWRVATRSLGLLSTLVLVRLLAPGDFGLVALAASFSVSIEAFSWIGIEEGVIRHKSPTPALMDTAFTLSVLRGGIIFLLIALAAIPAARFFAEPRLAPVLAALGLSVLIENLTNVGTIEFRRDFNFDREFKLYLVPRVLSIAAAITAAAALHTYWALITGILTNQLLRVAFSYAMHPYRPHFRLSEWRQMAGYSAWNSVISGAGALRDRVDTLMVGRLMASASVGFYALGFELASLPVTELIAPLTRAAFAGFAAAWRDDMEAGQTWLRLVCAMALLTFPAGIGMAAIAHPLIELAFGPGWQPAVIVLQVLGLPLCLTVFGMVGQTLFLAQGHMRTSFSILAVATAVRLALLALLIPAHGLAGAAIAAGLGIALEQTLAAAWAMRRLRLSLARDLLPLAWRGLAATAVMAAALQLTGLGWRPLAPAWLPLCVATGTLAYGAALLLLWLACGRPRGAEADAIALLARLRRRPR